MYLFIWSFGGAACSEAQRGHRHPEGHTASRETCPVSVSASSLFGSSHFSYLRCALQNKESNVNILAMYFLFSK